MCSKTVLVTITTIFIVIFLMLVLVMLWPDKMSTDSSGYRFRNNSPDISSIYTTREAWMAQPARNPLHDLELPATRLIIAHTGSETCETQAACILSVRLIQTFHIEAAHQDDIGYNFLIGGDGFVYEGRGWDKEGEHTRGFNKRSICIAFIGSFDAEAPPQRQLNAARMLIENGVLLGKLSADYKMYGHRQLMVSESPGDALYQVIKTWPHWMESTV